MDAGESIENDVSVRIERQSMFARELPPTGWFIIDESVLNRPFGGKSRNEITASVPGRASRTLASGGRLGRRQGLQCPVQGVGQRYLAVQSGQAEQLPGPGPSADCLQAGPVRVGPPGRAD